MLTLTLGDALLRDEPNEILFPNLRSPVIYILRDEGPTVFYIGTTYRFFQRLKEHCGLAKSSFPGCRSFVPLFHANYPASLNWCLEAYEPFECAGFLAEYLTENLRIDFSIEEAKGALRFPWPSEIQKISTEIAELALIARLRPCFNREHNPTPSIVPQPYDSQLNAKFKPAFETWELMIEDAKQRVLIQGGSN